jgi:hypothetical protein
MEESIKQKKLELDREKNKIECKKYYLEHKQSLIARGCEKLVCEKCGKMISRNYMGNHSKSKICKRREEIINIIKERDNIIING